LRSRTSKTHVTTKSDWNIDKTLNTITNIFIFISKHKLFTEKHRNTCCLKIWLKHWISPNLIQFYTTHEIFLQTLWTHQHQNTCYLKIWLKHRISHKTQSKHKTQFKILFRVTQHHVHIKLPEILYETSDARQTLITDYRPERNPNTDVTTVILTMLNTEWNVETHTKHDFNHKFIIQNVYKRLCTKWWWKTQWNLKTDMKPRGTF
jgi:hypothetical protein